MVCRCIFRLVHLAIFGFLLCLAALLQPGTKLAESLDKYGLVTGLGGLGDKAFNDMQHAGLVLAKTKYGIDFTVESPASHAENTKVTERLILDQGCTVIIGGGYRMVDSLRWVAEAHPSIYFILLDQSLEKYPPNLTSVTFRQNEGSFLAGALAAGMSKKNKIGFLGASEIPVIRDFFLGYKAGAQYLTPDVQVEEYYIGDLYGDFNPFMSPLRAWKMSLEIYDSGVDILFAAAAGSNKGVLAAAQERQSFAIGVDADQDHMAPGLVLTNMMKRLDLAILLMIEKRLAGELEPRNYSLGLAEGGVSLSAMTFTKYIIPEQLHNIIEKLGTDIINGDIQVPTGLQ